MANIFQLVIVRNVNMKILLGHKATLCKKVKQSRYRPGVVQRVPGS
jgi:hypothetical protein